MKRIYKGKREQEKILKDILNEDCRHDFFIILTRELNNSLDFLKEIMKVKPSHFSVAVGNEYIIFQPTKDDNGTVAFIDTDLMEILTKY